MLDQQLTLHFCSMGNGTSEQIYWHKILSLNTQYMFYCRSDNKGNILEARQIIHNSIFVWGGVWNLHSLDTTMVHVTEGITKMTASQIFIIKDHTWNESHLVTPVGRKKALTLALTKSEADQDMVHTPLIAVYQAVEMRCKQDVHKRTNTHTHRKRERESKWARGGRDVIPEPGGKYRVGHRSKLILRYLPTFSVNNL